MSGRKLTITIMTALILACFAACTGPEIENNGGNDPQPGTDQPQHQHSYEMTVTLAPTCTEAGTALYKCTSCGDSYEETIPARGHDMYLVEQVESKCVEEGKRVSACRNCDLVVTEMLPPAYDVHDHKPAIIIESTCRSAGSITYTCTRCGDSYTESISKIPHEFEEKSETLSVCSVCGQECSYPAELGFEGVKQLYENMRLELIETATDEELEKADPNIGQMWEEYSTFQDSEDEAKKGLYLYVRVKYMNENDLRIIDHERIHPFRYAYSDGEWRITTRYLAELNN